ncbi:hypothetical protein HZB07_01865 [Candidatus Saganbacteria bacterium]|nr:hypothetical protein [Candidatus Saganbacteria bacterium]
MSAYSSVLAKMKGLEEEVKVLRIQLDTIEKTKPAGFSTLYGIWKGKTNFSLEEIQLSHMKSKEF